MTTQTDQEYYLNSNVLTEIQVPEKGILSHTLFNDEDTKIVIFGFSPGQELTAHTAPMPATVQILSGEATLTLGSDTVDVSSGCLIHMRPKLVHGVVARTPMQMLLTLHKAARRNDP
jgi:quercetin dioxygenase-like cupin family protein